MPQRIKLLSSEEGASWDLPDNGILNIGRYRQHSEICLHDPKVSRIHCQVEVMDGGNVVITDLDSDTGTFINGERVTQHPLRPGDVLRVGDSELGIQALGGSKMDIQIPKSKTDIPVPKSKADIQLSKSKADINLADSLPQARAAAPAKAAPPAHYAAEALAGLAGTRLGHFDIGKLIGPGHAGSVFEARDQKENRALALKILHPEFPKNDVEMQNFVQIMKNLLPHRHVHVVTTFSIGRTQAYCWIARELVEGESVAQAMARFESQGLPDWHAGYRLAVHIGRALHFIHQRHLLHRNLTPQNILLRTTDNAFKLADMGLAKGLGGSALRQVCLRTKVPGELPYLPPEQTQPNPNLDPRSDIYGLGAVVYALLTGRPPFSAKTSAELVSLIRDVEPAEPRQWQPSMPDLLQAAVLRMLAKKPEDRYQNAGELLNHLARIAPDPG